MVCANINIRLDLRMHTNSFTQVTAHKNVAFGYVVGAAFEWVTLCGQSVSLARPMVTVFDLRLW